MTVEQFCTTAVPCQRAVFCWYPKGYRSVELFLFKGNATEAVGIFRRCPYLCLRTPRDPSEKELQLSKAHDIISIPRTPAKAMGTVPELARSDAEVV